MVNVYLVPTSTKRRSGGSMPPAPGWKLTTACGVRGRGPAGGLFSFEPRAASLLAPLSRVNMLLEDSARAPGLGCQGSSKKAAPS